MVYTKYLFQEAIFEDEDGLFFLADEELPKYYVPDELKEGKEQQKSKEVSYDNMDWYVQKIEEFDDDIPQAFGQHINAAISS